MKSLILSGILSLFVFSVAIANSNPKGDGESNNENGVIYLDSASFKEKVFDYEKNKEWKYNGKVPAIVDFYADWCGPCRMLAPVLDKLQKEYKGKIQIYKVDTDKQKELASIFGIRSLPTIVFIPTDADPQAMMGFRPQEDLEKMIKEILKVDK